MAFKILRTRLKTVPSYSFTGDQFKWLSGSPYSQIEVGDMDEDLLNAHNGIKFASRLQQFEQMQHQHRMNSKSQSQSRYSSNSWMKVCRISDACPNVRIIVIDLDIIVIVLGLVDMHSNQCNSLATTTPKKRKANQLHWIWNF